MYEPIIATLDGSPLAEEALPQATSIAQAAGSRVVLFGVAQPVIALDEDFVRKPEIDEDVQPLTEYLNHQAERLRQIGLNVSVETRIGDPAACIVEFAAQQPAALLVMATHGRSGLRRLAFGSVADKVLHRATVPVLLVRAGIVQAGAKTVVAKPAATQLPP